MPAFRSKNCAARKAQIDDRMLVVDQLPDDEYVNPTERDDREQRRSGGIEPVELLALVEHDLQRADPDHQQRQADAVDGQLARGVSRCGRSPTSPRPQHTHWNIDVENPRPGNVVSDPSPEQRAHHRRDQRRHGPNGERRAGLGLGVTRQQQRLRERDHGPATAPCMTRKAISSRSDVARPHISEAIENKRSMR